ncbi:ABC-type sugar transport system substrate-binding protein [Fontibacillus solani]|uniref:ABC-type sugar transport system substrate-binding protein n=1 Tax=Fontibacillus solani TaxID=1572857 RepID=A0A7W3SSQ3_9BACL|nr:hypothetical protein [Fontibacillus solani]MBA9085364.1 ABC-type sugar transport system substrate-binding protein [Fontibacillus solani]
MKGIYNEKHHIFRKPVFRLIMLVLVLAISACGIKKEAAPSNNGAEGKELAGKRIAPIMEFNAGTFFQQYVQGVTEEVNKFGGEITQEAALYYASGGQGDYKK